MRQLKAATDLYKDHFLGTFSIKQAREFENWMLLQRQIWNQRIDVIFARLVELQRGVGETLEMLNTVHCWLRYCPTSESAYQSLMQVHFAGGNSSAVLQA